MKEMLLRFRIRPQYIPLLFLIVIVAAYGLLISSLGFYWDDWTFAWLAHFLGPAEFIPAFRAFRPFLGPIFALTTALLDANPLVWQVAGLLTRFLLSLSAWWAFSAVWPRHKEQVMWAILLITVYPGYGQQWVALTHVNQEWIPLICYLLSLGLTARALRDPSRFRWETALALGFMFVGLFSTEYFIGLEVLRGLIIFFVLTGNSFADRLRGAFRKWLPYLILWAVDAVWLFEYYRSGQYASYQLKGLLGGGSSTLPAILTWVREFLSAIVVAGVQAWLQLIDLFKQPLSQPFTWVIFAFSLICFVILAVLLPRVQLESDLTARRAWALQALAFGTIGLLAGRIPSWIAGLKLSLDYDTDRLLISMMIGACFFLVGLMVFLLRSRTLQILLLSGILALSMGFQLARANVFRHDLELLQRFFWQLSWRVPAMKPGTVLLTNDLPIPLESDFQLSAPLNWIYAPDQSEHKSRLDYLLMETSVRLGQTSLPSLAPDQPIRKAYRTALFSGSTSDAIVLSYFPFSCVKVLDQAYFDKSNLPEYLGADLSDMVGLSDLSRIIAAAPQPKLPSILFGKEPEHSWCYYYEKADLARQEGDWSTVKDLLAEATSKGYKPQDPLEWLLVIESDLRNGAVSEAIGQSKKLLQDNPYLKPNLCKVLSRASDLPQSASDTIVLADFAESLHCAP